jgi:hypothetical protein
VGAALAANPFVLPATTLAGAVRIGADLLHCDYRH